MMSPGLGDQQRKSSTDGAHLDQGILGKIQNAHIKCYRCEGFGHYVRDCPTKHTSAALTITPSKNVKKNASSKDRTGPVHIDPETTLVIDTIWRMAKTHYPTPKGCKTRLEIDDNLKRKGDNHKIANKDVPPPPRQSDTTLSNQCDILDKLWWKDMLYDRILENLYCLMCQKGFRTIKQYQDHVNGRMHRNLNSTLLSAKTGWAVRTKLLKKLGSLPTIFEEPLPGEDKKPFPDIKPDLLSENIFNKKFFVCRVCKTWGETPLQSHFESKRHKFLYENQWKCEVCNMYFKGYQDFKIHADSLIHTQVMKKTKGIKSESPSPTKESEDDTTPKRKRSSETSDKPTAAKKSKYSTRSLTEEEEGLIEMVWTSDDQWSVAHVGESTSAVSKSQDLTEKKPSEESGESESEEATNSTKNEDDEDEEAVPGLQFLIPVTGFYCKLCGKFYNEDKMPKKEHCLTKVHRSKVKLWYRENKKRTIADETGLDEKESEGADKIKVKDEDGKTGEEESEVLVKEEGKDEDEVLKKEDEVLEKEDEVLEKEQKVNEKEQQPSEEVNDERPEDEVVSEDQQIIALDEDTSTAVISVGNVGNVERLQQEQEDLDVDVVGDEVVEDDKGSKADGSEPESKMDVDADETAGDDSELKSKEPPGVSEGEESKANAADNVKDEIEDSQLDENNQQEVLADAAENNEDDDEEPDLVNTADSEDDEGAMLPGDAEDSGEDEPSTVPQIMVESVDAEEIKEEEEQIQGSGEGAPVVEDPQDESEEKQQDPSQNTEEDEQISKDDEKQTEDDVTEGGNEKPCGSDVSGTLETDGGEDTVIDENKRRTRRSRVTRSKANKQSPKKGTKGKR